MLFEQQIEIQASAGVVERCFTELPLIQTWLNPRLKCEALGEWSTAVGAKSRFRLQIPPLYPTLNNVVICREPGLIVWQFEGFFQGRDRWECSPVESGTLLINRFDFSIPNPLVAWGFQVFAARWTIQDMQAQLRRLQALAEDLYRIEQDD
ncbi:MAG: SRPBCC family protein [Cyanobacteriota bacterium]|jgi:hypothetical protein